ncbi:TonB-dependent receptor domain-containing protein [Sphingobium fuliginis]|uniref:TonB-dependent receptor n=1 Tax=Sphingobium fuliginis ATCC 27551 TaxID=1208342 RepID=A0A5B8CLX8_SPHSA|nr:TonB-dependent receptor [Sphingobium fuliginis]QDC39577.1 TonB-dependent receptor [Sphingobium fuliginis ATCC 27551]
MKLSVASATCVGVSLLALVAPAMAQTAPQVDGAQLRSEDPADAGTDAAASDIIVTGSRIVRDGYTAPTPVTVATTEDLVKATPTNVPDALNKLPQFQNSSSPSRSSHNFANSASHGNVLNLRGVGGNRTLILFDGMRVPPTTYQGTVDTNVIPNALLQRVDIVTAGASAAYGSDAVAGVVNFVLNRKFTGLTGSVQAGVSQRGDNGNQRISLAGGMDLFGGRGHLLLSGEYYNNDGMLRSDRKGGNANYVYVGSVPGSTAAPGSNANPRVLQDNIHLIFASDNGKILDGPFANYQINGDGTIRPFDNGTPTGTAAFNIGGDGFVIPSDVHAVAPLRTYQTFGRFSYDVTDDINFFVQGNFTRSELSYISQSNAWVGTQNAPVFQGNPFIPARIEAALTPGQQFNIGKYSGDSAKKPFTQERTDFWMATAGLEGNLGDGWKWSVNYTHGSSRHSVDQHGLYDYQKAYAALDAVRDTNGNIVCRPTLSADPVIRARFAGCQPLNIFLTGDAYTNQPGYDYATGTMSYDARIKHDAAALQFQGSPFELPGGPVDIVVGGEWRKQSLDLTSNSDPSRLDTAAERSEYFAGLRGVSSTSLFYWLTNVGQAQGSVTVKEAFGEINLPIVKDMPFLNSLELNGAGRITDYSTSGQVETWKVGLTWKPVQDILLRGTISRDIRAPTLFDLFAGDQSGIGLLTDPVSGQSGNVSTVSGGNRLLDPEKAKTRTFGFVLTPRFLPGFSLSADYFNLKIDGAIGTLDTTRIVQNCVANASAPECALITRPSPTAFPSLVRIAAANIARLETAGVDIDASYATRLGNGNFSARAYVSWLDKYVTQQSAAVPAYDSAGYGINNGPIARPKWRGTLNLNYVSDGGLTIFVSEQYTGPVKVGSREPNNNYSGAKAPSVWYTDLTISQKIEGWGGSLEPFITINNLFDRDPPLVAADIPGVNLPTIISTYDTVGRAFTAGVRFKF